MKNIALSTIEKLPEDFEIVEIDASKTTTLRAFYEEMAKVFEFPDYFAFNLDSFDEIINDLSWIENEKLLVYFINSSEFLKNERNESKILTLLDLLDSAAEEWKWADEELIPKKDLLIRFSPSQRMEKILDKII